MSVHLSKIKPILSLPLKSLIVALCFCHSDSLGLLELNSPVSGSLAPHGVILKPLSKYSKGFKVLDNSIRVTYGSKQQMSYFFKQLDKVY